jgi:hypothetical protein
MAPIRLLTYREARRARTVATTARAHTAALPDTSTAAAPIAHLADDLQAALDERAAIPRARRVLRRRDDRRQPLRTYLASAHSEFTRLVAAHATA